jgi:dsDNA-specific endonuclease/ATPase MutS2
MARFAAGDRVHVLRIGTGEVREVRNGRRYVVEIKGRSMVVAGDQLESAARSPKQKDDQAPRDRGRSDSQRDVGTPPSLDLHGKTVPESLDALDTFLNDAILDGHPEARIIHGRSGGRLRAAVRKRLGELTAVRSFRIDPANPGVTIVIF